ncbi:MAG: terminase small subunit [Bryobacteraceae bacterium]|jgi:hypothetical protein
MPALTKGKLEQFAQSIANGLTPAAAYVRAGYSIKGAASSAARLLQNAPICARIAELRQAIAAELLPASIRDLDAVIQAKQQRRELLYQIARERGLEMAGECPGGSTGFIVRRYFGHGQNKAATPMYQVDVGFLREISELEEEVGRRLGQTDSITGAPAVQVNVTFVSTTP